MSFELVKPGTNIDFIGKRQVCAAVSAALILASIVATQINGIKLGIDFAGGTEIQFKFDSDVIVSDGTIREVLGSVEGIDNLSVIRYGEVEENEFLVK